LSVQQPSSASLSAIQHCSSHQVGHDWLAAVRDAHALKLKPLELYPLPAVGQQCPFGQQGLYVNTASDGKGQILPTTLQCFLGTLDHTERLKRQTPRGACKSCEDCSSTACTCCRNCLSDNVSSVEVWRCKGYYVYAGQPKADTKYSLSRKQPLLCLLHLTALGLSHFPGC